MRKQKLTPAEEAAYRELVAAARKLRRAQERAARQRKRRKAVANA